MFGFFEVIENKGIFVKLQLPQSIKIHNVLYSNLLQTTLSDPLTNQINKPPPPININNKEEWEVEIILDARSHWGKLQY